MSTKQSMRGFSLLEMIVSVGIFAIMMLVATSTYFTLIAIDRRARATNQVVSNISFAVDAMTRGMRTGTGYQCLNNRADSFGNSPSGCTQFSYIDPSLPAGSNVVTYFMKANGTIGRCESNTTCLIDASAVAITDPAITITSLTFYVRGVGNTDDFQPQVLFTIKGSMPADSSGNPTTFILEESATQRLIDI